MIHISPTRDLTQVPLDTLSNSPTNVEGQAQVVFMSTGLDLTNRDALIGELALPSGASDDTILIEGWRAWGEDLPDKLRGPFAFALYLPRDHSIYAARDIFGLCPLYYAVEDGILTLGSDSRAVRATLPGQGTPNEVMLADFVNNAHIESEQTFFIEIRRLPQAHHMRITSITVSVSRYWLIEDVPRNVSQDDAALLFRKLFDRAVTDCAGEENSVLLISGGMDSSSIAGSMRAQNQTGELHAAALTFPDSPGWEDKPYLEDITAHASLNLVEFPSDCHNPLSDMEKWLEAMDGPYLPRGWSISARLLPILRERGFTRVISGQGGDEVVSIGLGRLNELAMSGRWLELFRETRAATGFYSDAKQGRWRTFRVYLAHLPLYRFLRDLRAKFKRWRNPASSESARSSLWLSAEMESLVGQARYARKSVMTQREHTDRAIQEEAMGTALLPLSLEVFSICAKASGVELRFPFYDRDLFELSLSLPSDWKLRDGLTRYLIRAAMGDDLPHSIRQRPGKYDFGGQFESGLRAAKEEALAKTDPSNDLVARFVNLETLVDLRAKLLQDGTQLSREQVSFLWRVAVLAMWFEIAKEPLAKPQLSVVQ